VFFCSSHELTKARLRGNLIAGRHGVVYGRCDQAVDFCLQDKHTGRCNDVAEQHETVEHNVGPLRAGVESIEDVAGGSEVLRLLARNGEALGY